MLLRKGDKGELVQALQEALLALGYHPGPIDGHFGGLTEEALEKFRSLPRFRWMESADKLRSESLTRP